MHKKPVEEIAIIGMGCRFPGAPNVPAFWRLLRDGMDAVREVPPERWDRDAIYEPRPATMGKTVSRCGGFVDDIERFDPMFFGLSPRHAIRTDPQQRMLLEAAWEAMENAGLRHEQVMGTNGGVFVGLCTDDYMTLERNDPKNLDMYTGIGGNRGAAAGRLTYFFGLNGPSTACDTACSSSLVALHLACNAIRAGDCDFAFVGGSNTILHPITAVAFSQAGMLSPDGRCKAFDASANGFVRAEGAGVVIVKAMRKALQDGDPIYGVILGSAMNNDGQLSPMMTPSREGQELVLRAAYENAGLDPSLIQYVEAHGTGTAVGDPIEIDALAAVLGQGRPPERTCLIGSCKTNIGHLEGGAGVAGLIKALLCLQHNVLPPTIHIKELNPAIPWETLPFRVVRALEPWPDTHGQPRYTAVNSFGITGTNVHVVLREGPKPAPTPVLEVGHLLTLTAQSQDALTATARAYADWLAGSSEPLHDICYSAAARRTHHNQRLALVGGTREEMVDQINAFLEGGAGQTGTKGEPRKPVFVFSGVGTHWIGMGRRLQDPVFRARLEECDDIFQEIAGWSVIEAIETGARLDEVEVMQPAIFSMQVALAALWRSWGIEPGAVVGHSLGEAAAAHVAGVLSLRDAALAVRSRSRLMQSINGTGRMLAVEMSLEEARAIARQHDVDVAVCNSPTSCVLSGDPEAIGAIQASLEERSVFARFVRADVAFHSRHMEPLVRPLNEALAGIAPRAESVPIYSTVTGARAHGTAYDAAYWSGNMRQPVLFARAVEALVKDGWDTFLEVSPHPVLLTPIRQCASSVTTLGSLKRDHDERSMLLATLGALWCAGHAVDWTGVFPGGGRLVQPPPYPWQRERYWFEADASKKYFAGFGHRSSAHPLLTTHFQSAHDPGTHYWEADIDVAHHPYFNDHRLQGSPLLPAAAYLEMALGASIEAYGEGPRTIRNVRLHKPLFLTTEPKRIQLMMAEEVAGAVTFRFYSASAGTWDLQVSGEVALRAEEVAVPFVTDLTLDELVSQFPEYMEAEAFYEMSKQGGLEYHNAFRGVRKVWRDGDDAVVALQVPEPLNATGFCIHPVLMDVLLQSYIAFKDPAKPSSLPVGVGTMHFARFPRPSERLWVRLHSQQTEDGREGSFALYDEEGVVIARQAGQRSKHFTQKASEAAEWLYEQAWEEKERRVVSPTEAGRWLLMDGASDTTRHLSDLLRARGEDTLIVRPGESREDMLEILRAFQASGDRPWRGVVHLGALVTRGNDGLDTEALAAAERENLGTVLHLVQALSDLGAATRLWLVTRGAQAVNGEAPALAQSAMIGLGRVAFTENPALRVSRVDMDPSDHAPNALCDELMAGDFEPEVALRGQTRWVARLGRYDLDRAPAVRRRRLRAMESCRLYSPGDGVLDHLVLRPLDRVAPAEDEVEIEVVTVGLNFLDVLGALNQVPGRKGEAHFGMECAGRVVAVGEGVTDLAPGDEVMALNAGGAGCFRRFLNIPARKVFKKPASLSFEEAATIPVAYQTAWYALHYLGRMRKGEAVLVHCGAGGVGQAAIEIARQAGAVIYSTAGTPEKRAYLKSLGVRHVMSSRNLDFAQEIMDVTEGRGVDLVLNSLAGEAIPKSLDVLSTGGRFLEIGKRDIYGESRINLWPFQKNLSFYAIDLFRLAKERPDILQEVTDAIVEKVQSGAFKPLPHRVFPVSQVGDAFRYMAQGKHTGKIVISFEDSEAMVDEPLHHPVRPDATYLITGGLGALGIAFSKRLVEQGARHLALVGRRAPSPEVEAALDEMRAAGAVVRTFAADVARASDVSAMLGAMAETMPPLRGVLHAAGTLADGILQRLDWEQFEKVLEPKTRGAWNLHQALREVPLDFFVMFSSAATTFGAAGQGNYAAANAFLDALAHYRRADGKAALSVSWGPWAEVGMAAASADRGGRLAARGKGGIPTAAGTAVLDDLLGRGATHVTVAPVDWKQWQAAQPEIAKVPMLSGLVASGGTAAASDMASRPADAPAMEAYLLKVIARVLKMSESRLDASVTLLRLGIDSLTAVELKNRIENELSVTVPVVKLLEGPTVSQLAAWLLAQSSGPAGSPEQPTVQAPVLAPSRKEDVAVSCGQQRLWLTDMLSPGDPTYNIYSAVRFRGRLDVPAAERAFAEIVRRHESLRTRFTAPDGELVAIVEPSPDFSVRVISLEEVPEERREEEARRLATEEARRPFDLAKAPLMRVLLMRLSESDHVMVVCVHHIACDAWSIGILETEFTLLYMGMPVAELEVQYPDYAAWQREKLAGGALDVQMDYWRSRLQGAPTLDLPTDMPRPPIVTHRGGAVYGLVEGETLEALRALCRRTDATLYMVLLAAWQRVLARRSGQDEVVIGCPVSNRDDLALNRLIGFFVNTLVIRGDVSGEPPFDEQVARTRMALLEAFANQEVPFERLVEELKVRRDLSRNPLYQVAATLQTVPFDGADLPGLRVDLYPIHNGTAKFDLCLEMLERPEGLTLMLEYSADLFQEDTVRDMLAEFTTVLQEAATHAVQTT